MDFPNPTVCEYAFKPGLAEIANILAAKGAW
jgi:hypothetical protein